MADVVLKNIKKVYPNIEPKKKKKGEPEKEKKNNLLVTEEGVLAVHDFNLEIKDNEFIVLVGPSGCGKSTTLRMIAGLEEISGGELYIDGKLMNDIPPKDRDIAMVFQNYALYPHMTVYKNMAFGLQLRRVPKAEIDGDMGDSHVGQLARLMSQAMRKLTAVISKSKCVAIFINQVREKIGVLYGNPETTPGGRALKFYASVRMEVRRGEAIKENGTQIGNRTKVKISKNKVAPPFRECEFDIMYGEGISLIGELIDLGVKLGLVQKSGSWYSMGETRIGQGRDAAKQYLKNNPEIADNLEAEIRRNFDKLMTGQSRVAAKAAGRAVDVSADDFKDED